MWRRERPSKRVSLVVLVGCMLFGGLACTMSERMGEVQAATVVEELHGDCDGAIMGELDTSLYTSTESVLGKTYNELVDSLDKGKFEDYIATLEDDISYVIPGIDQTNIKNEKTCGAMVPQGLCIAEDYLIISAYDNCKEIITDSSRACDAKSKSVLYIMDMETREYLTTISLNTRCHVGALAYNPDDELIYVADSVKNVVQKLSLSKIRSCVESGKDTGPDILKFDDGAIDTQGYTPSFLAYYQERLYVGQFARFHMDELFSNQMAVYATDGTLMKEDTITLPYYSQGVTFADWEGDTYMLVSSSFGREKTAKLHVYLMGCKEDGSLRRKQKIGEMCCPNMSEDITIQGDYIYTCYESAANFYRFAMDGKGSSHNAIDRIMVSSLGETITVLMDETSEDAAMPVMCEKVVRYIALPRNLYMWLQDDYREF